MKKMEGEKPHRSSGGSSELFICFTSRPSSSSMKISSKSILSLGRTEKFRDGSSSSSTLHTSLSRRLRHNGSMKGGQSSPMFPTTGKKKGCSFETPEPTSPKVTCIGQVRVKTKKQGKKMRARSKRRGEGSFRKSQEGLEKAGEEEKLGRRSQRWVSLPLSICEALRALGAEFNCFMPCGGRSSCWSSGVERGKGGEKRSTSCGAVFARWLMAVDEGEEEKRREIEEPIVLVVENRRENREEEIEVKEAEAKETKVEEEAEEDDDDESSTICIPPKNALLLMRCRSEPLRMASYMNRFWESPAPEEDEEEDVDDDDDDDDNDEREEEEEPEERAKKDVNNEENERVVSKEELEQMQEEDTTIPSKSVASADATEESENTAEEQATVEVEVEVEESNEPREEQEGNESSDEMVVDISSSVEKAPEEPQNSTDEEKEDNTQTQSPKSEVEAEDDECRETHLQKIEEEAEKEEEEIHLQKADDLKEEETETLMEQPEVKEEEDDESRVSSSSSAIIQSEADPLKEEGKSTEDQTHETVKEEKSTTAAEILVEEEEESERETEKRNEEIRDKSLPECLLLMLCEPKLSMEVSKETWVCSTDFLRWRPEKQTSTAQTQICADDGDNDPTGSHLPHPPPATSNPAPTSDNHAQPPVSDPPEQQPSPAMVAVVEQKMASAATYEPFILTRCKSEPVRSSDKLAPEACFWKSRKLEQHPLGIGAAGIGF